MTVTRPARHVRSKRHYLPLFVLLLAVLIQQPAAASNSGNQNSPGWGLDKIDERNPFGHGDHDEYRWVLDGAESDVNIYVIDTGIRSAHEEFSGRIGGDSQSFYPGVSSIEDCDSGSGGHGTHNAGIAAGTTYGVAKGAIVHALRTAPDVGCEGEVEAATAAFTWVANNGTLPGVINMSFRFDSGNASPTQLSNLHTAIEAAIDAGFVVTLSAGCTGDVNGIWTSNITSRAIVVAGTDDSGNPSLTEYGSGLALYAPGEGVEAAGNAANDDYWESPAACGDSYAAAYAAGVAALVLSGYPAMAPDDVRSLMIAEATQGVVNLSGCSNCPSNRFLYSAFMEMEATFVAPNSDFVSADDNGGGSVTADAGSAGSWETFQLIDLNGGHLEDGDPVAIRTTEGWYWHADGGGGGALTAEGRQIGTWETFTLHLNHSGVVVDDDDFWLETYTGHFVSAVGGGGGGMVASATGVSSNEVFRMDIQ